MEPNPRDKASFLSKVTFWWLYPLMLEGCRRPLEKKDLFDASEQHASLKLGDLVGRKWAKEQRLSKERRRTTSYIRAVSRSFGPSYLLYGAFVFLEECVFKICAPLFLGHFIRYINKVPGYTTTWGYLLVSGITLTALAVVISHQMYFYFVQCTGMMIRVASCSLIYRKALRLSTKALSQTTVGQLVNLLSNDVSRFDTSVLFLHFLWVGPSQTVISAVILWYELGPSCISGFLLIIVYVLIMSGMGGMFSKLRLETANRTDERTRIMNEIVNAIRFIKMYVWEKPFNCIIEKARRLESKVIMKSSFLRAINLTLFLTSSKLLSFIILLIYALTGNPLTADKVFLTCALVSHIELSMTHFFPSAISLGSETFISCKRIQNFLDMEEREECDKVRKSALRPKIQNCFVEGEGICAKWDPASEGDSLYDVSFFVKAGEIMALVGPVGSGKSSLLHAILSELPIKEGSINVKGRIAYAPQEPWLFSGSVKDNILFGQLYDATRYKNVLKVCALERDMELLPDGDQTTVGERGITLSGGQKARISLARAVYFDADIYLLDDPLSAVDAHVGKHLFEQCIAGFLRHKVVILATNQLQFIKATNYILFLRKGRVEMKGTYDQIKENCVDFAKIVAVSEEDLTVTEDNELRLLRKITLLKRASETWSSLRGSSNDLDNTTIGSNCFLAPTILGGSVLSVPKDEIYDIEEKESREIIEAETEDKSTGSVRMWVYMEYFMAGGGLFLFLLLFLLNVAAEVLHVGSGYWLSYWTNMEQMYGECSQIENKTSENYEEISANNTEFVFTLQDRFRYVYIYTGITLLFLTMSFVRTVLFFRICVTSARNLHNRMFSAIIRAPMKFFETHSIGQILNRFTKDIGQVDDLLPPALFDFVTIMFIFCGIIGMILALNVWMLLPTVVLGAVFLLLRWMYLSFAREIKRLEGTTRSPVFSCLSSTLHGLSTIRAFNAENTATVHFDSHQDLHTSAWFLFVSSSRIFGAYLDVLCALYIGMAAFSYMFKEDAVGGNVGLSISLAMMLSGMFQWGVKQSAEVENHMTSVERILEYSSIAPEVFPNAEQLPKQPDWPSKGELIFEDVCLYYNENDQPVLKNLNFVIEPAEKVGIVGRSGAGKSSLLTCLFRLTQPQGNIIIDGMKTNTLQLDDLRKSISIIPQDPTLFNGTVRYNLDPFSDYSDEKIWNALEEVQLKTAVAEMNEQLNAHISEGGSNLSVGQRQLMCLARTILKHNKILMMDEATANVDPETDSWIQRTIREKFTDCTVLTIAHRLHTIMDSDRVMVMDSGKLMEFASPFELLKEPNSLFSQLVNQTDPATSQTLKKIAEEAFNKRKKPTNSPPLTDQKIFEDLPTSETAGVKSNTETTTDNRCNKL